MRKKTKGWRLLTCVLVLLGFFSAFSQPVSLRTETVAESNIASQWTLAPDEDLFDELSRFLKKPLLLNEADKEQLQQLVLLSDVLVDRLLEHRKLLGPLLHLNELQTIAGFTPELIRQIEPYVRVAAVGAFSANDFFSFRGVRQDLLYRVTGLFRSGNAPSNPHWVGSEQRILIWHRLQTKTIQLGWLAEKDPGETILRKGRPVVDHVGFHVFWQGKKLLRTVALGDYTVNLGQGLLHWQSMAFGKSAAMSWIKRQGEVIRPHRASGEVNFHRGIATCLALRKMSLHLFFSARSLSGRLLYDSASRPFALGSINSSGYHRSPPELSGRKVAGQSVAGVRLSTRVDRLQLSVNAVGYRFSLPLVSNNEPRNLFDIQGKTWFNGSIDLCYTRKNVHGFGEWAIDARGKGAVVAGAMLTPAAMVDLFLVVRSIAVGYRSLYSNAFTESSSVENERGVYLGITIRPNAQLRLDAYADHFVFPWIRYRAAAPTAGSEFLVQLYYRPAKKTELLFRYRSERKWEVGYSDQDVSQIAAFDNNTRSGWRSQFSYDLTPRVSVRTRVEWVRLRPEITTAYRSVGSKQEHGFLYYAELLCNRASHRTNLAFRYQFYDTKSYQSRIYAMSPDLRPGFGIGAFYGKGSKLWINVDKSMKNNILISLNGQLALTGSLTFSRELRLQIRFKLE